MTLQPVHVVTENNGFGDSFTVAAVYSNREAADRHVFLAKFLMPRTARTLKIIEMPVLEAIPGLAEGEAA